MANIGIISPGKMGRTIGLSLIHKHKIFFASNGRSEENINKAISAGFNDVGDLSKMVAMCDVIICIGTLDIAFDTPKHIFRNGCNFEGLYIDFNSLNGEREENKWRTLINGLTDKYVEGAIRGYPLERLSDAKPGSHLMLVSGKYSHDVYGIFADTIWGVQYSESPAKIVNRYMASSDSSVHLEPMHQDKTTPKKMDWEHDMLDLIANKYYVDGRTGAQAMIAVWTDINNGKLKDVAKELGFPEQLGMIHAINTFGKNITINHSLDRTRGDIASWHLQGDSWGEQ